MNKKLIILLLLNKNIWVYSQSIGLGLGVNINSLKTNINDLTFSEVTPKIGSNYQVKFIDRVYIFSWELGLGIIEKDYSITRTDRFSSMHNTYENTYLQLPAKLHYNLFKNNKFKVYINSGIFFGYWLFSQQSGIIPNVFDTSNIIYDNGEISQSFKYEKYETKYKINPIKDDRIEFGISSGVQVTYNIFEKYCLLLGFSYNRALTDQQKEYMLNQHKKINSTVLFEGGLMFYIHQKETRSDA